MSEVELHFGTLCVIIRDDKKELLKIKDIAHQTLLTLIPEAKKVIDDERQFFLERNRLMGEGCEDFDDQVDCSQKQTKKVEGLYG
jgi:hypothetical protein